MSMMPTGFAQKHLIAFKNDLGTYLSMALVAQTNGMVVVDVISEISHLAIVFFFERRA